MKKIINKLISIYLFYTYTNPRLRYDKHLDSQLYKNIKHISTISSEKPKNKIHRKMIEILSISSISLFLGYKFNDILRSLKKDNQIPLEICERNDGK